MSPRQRLASTRAESPKRRHRPAQHICLKCLRFVALLAVLVHTPLDAFGQDSQEKTAPPKVRHIFVPADKPDSWPKGNWVPMRLEDYQDLLSAAQPSQTRPPAAWIEHAEYQAVLVDGALQKGKLTGRVRSPESDAALLSLEPCNLAISALRWNDRDAVWGTTPEGTTALLVNQDANDIHALWSLNGRSIDDRIEFDLRLAPATGSRLDLQIPAGMRLESSTGDVSSHPDESGWTRWQIDLGTEDQARLTVYSHAERSGNPAPLVFVERSSSYVLRQGGVFWQSDLNLDVADGSIASLAFRVPEGVTVHSVTYGTAYTLSLQPNESPLQQRLEVALPDRISGRGHRVRIVATADVEVDRPWILPRLTLENSVHLDGKSNVTVESPLELKTIDPIGFQQTSAISHANEGETFTFRQFLPDARMVVQVGVPRPFYYVHALHYAQLESDGWTLSAQVQWEAQKGSTFVTRLALPPMWEVTGVKAIGQPDSTDVLNWKVNTIDETTRELAIEFREALSPGKPKTVEVLARRLTVSTELPTGVPLLEPLEAEHAEYLVAIAHPKALELVWAASHPEIIVASDAADFWRDFPLWARIESDDQAVVLLRPRAEDRDTKFSFRNTQGRFEGRVHVNVEVTPEYIRESYQVECAPLTEPIHRLLVYVTPAESDIEWRLVESWGDTLVVSHLDRQMHAQWKLPTAGDLWELRLPQPRGSTIHLVGERERPATSGDSKLALVFLPQASPFKGRVALYVDDRMDVSEQSQELIPIDEPVRPPLMMPAGGDVPLRCTLEREWRYESSDCQLGIRLDSRTTGESHELATLALVSQLTLDGDFDLHQATFRGIEGLGRREFRFELPYGATLADVKVDGQTATAERVDDSFLLPALAGKSRDEVAIRYRLPAHSHRFGGSRTILFPKTTTKVLSVEWHVALAPRVLLTEVPSGMRSDVTLPDVSWSERFFGPLGRPRERSSFAAPSPGTNGNADIPADWHVLTLTALSAPESVSLELWDASRAEQLAWVGLLFGALLTAALRIARGSLPMPAAIWWLCLCVVGAVLAPPVYAKIIGGVLAGTVIASLVPRWLFESLRIKTEQPPIYTVGSTHTVTHVGVILFPFMIAGMSLLASTSIAQQLPTMTARSDAPLEIHEYDVLVPANPDTRVIDQAKLVYLPQELLDVLRDSRQPTPDSPRYLVMAAQYVGSISDQDQAALQAHFTVAVLADEPSVRVELPLGNANLGGESACLVNGRPHPVLRSPAGGGVVLELVRESRVAGVPDARTAPNNAPASQAVPELFDIELQLHPRTLPTASGGSFAITIPNVLSSRLELSITPQVQRIGVPIGNGWASLSRNGQLVTAELGSTSHMEVIWSRTDTPLVQTPALDATVACLLEAHATWVLARHRIQFSISDGPIEFLSLRVPHGAAVRNVHADDLLRYSVVPSDDDRGAQLLVEFRRPVLSDFRIEIESVIPIQSSGPRFEIPAIDLFGGTEQSNQITVTSRLVGVSTSAEFQLQPIRNLGSDATEVGVDRFLESWGQLDGAEVPDIALQLRRPTVLSFLVEPSVPHRMVENSYTGRIREGFLEWNLTARVRTLGSPAYQHVLQIDPQLRIDTVSVQEDEAERLLRWSRLDGRLVLFLQDKTTGTQTILLKGVLPLESGRDIELPVARFENADHEDSRILLYDASDQHVSLIGSEAYEFGETAQRNSEKDAADVLLGGFRYRDNAQPPSIHIEHDSPSDVLADRATALVPQAHGGWTMTSLLRFHSSGPLPKRVRVRVPAEIAGAYKLLKPDKAFRIHPLSDGAVQLVFQLPAEEINTFDVRISAPLEEWDADRRRLPVPSAMQATPLEDFLLVSSNDLIRPLESTAIEMPWLDAPDWLEPGKRFGLRAIDSKIFRNTSPDWSVLTLRAPFATADREVPLLETLIWPGSDDKSLGMTRLFAFGTTLSRMELNWPDQTDLEAVIVDQQVMSIAQPESGRLTIPLDQGMAAHVVSVFWSRPDDETFSQFTYPAKAIPFPANAAVKQSLLCVIPPEGTQLLPRSGVTSLSAFDYRVDRFERLLETCESQFAVKNQISTPLWAAVQQAHSAVVPEMTELVNEPDGFEESRRYRYMSLSRRLQTLEKLGDRVQHSESTQVAALASANAPLIEAEAVSRGTAILAETEGAEPVFWKVPSGLMRWGIVLLGIVLAILVHRKVPLASVRESLDDHPVWALAVLAALWWVFLTPRLIGPLLLVLAAGLALHDWLGRRRAPQASEGSWSDL